MSAVDLIAREMLAFINAQSTLAIVAAIFADLLSGLVAALRTRNFELQRVGNFYLSNVIPYVIGYGGLYVFTGLGLDQYLAPNLVDALQPITSAPALLALAGSIFDNIQRARYVPVRPHETPYDTLPTLELPPNERNGEN